eukprot:CAMPEP_0185804928 /NCGR_PEP_ID=MMETSP1322-20130828/3544_1 /TAXON_ID=265543 /ORGANISM="Minutocellus polymorphus, Strain RCC2270" /LENGTH=263 /DNA_ID=CAMNT_0028500927 /DNA_START=121 /DNA_END=912 /DNA_ORIENTATION=+
MEEDGGDRLRQIHDELSANPEQHPKSSSWLPLESNPEMFTSFARRIGNLPPEWSFIDVIGFDNEALQYTPRPVAAVILLFPCTDAIYAARAEQKKMLAQELASGNLTPAAKSVLHVEQVASFGNACGSIACVHALSNVDLSITGPLAQFKETTARLSTARERGNILVASDIQGLSDMSASDSVAQTECPDTGDTYLGHHYCAFVSVNDHIVELDGTKVAPVDHGPMSSDSDLLQEAARVIKNGWMQVEPDRIDFSMVALAKTR